MLGIIHQWTQFGWCFLFWKFINYLLNLLNRYRPTQIASFLCEFWQIVSFKELVHFLVVMKFVGIHIVYSIVFLYMFVGSVAMFPFLFLILVICVLSFFPYLSRLEFYDFIDHFQEPLLILLVISLMFCYQVHWVLLSF